MVRAPTPKPNTQAIAQLDQDFDKVKKLAKSAEKQEGDAQDTLAKTLDAMFGFGQQLRANPMIMEEFFGHKEIKLNKASRENPYIGLVKLAFAGTTKKAMQSKYARVLHYVHDSKLNDRVEDFVGQNGIGECYTVANDYFGKGRKEAGKVAKDKQIELGQDALNALAASASFQLRGIAPEKLIAVPQRDSAGKQIGTTSYVNAVVRIGSDGITAVIADVLDTSDGEWNHIFSRYCSRTTAVHKRLAQMPANPLLHAIWHVAALAPDAAKHGKIVLRVKDNNALVEFASTDHAFRAVRMALDEAPNPFPSEPVGFDLADAKQFAGVYTGQTDWQISQSGNDMVISSVGASKSFTLTTPIAGLSVGIFAGQKSKHFTLPWTRLNSIPNDKTLLPSTSANAASQGPALLRMDIDGASLGVSNVRRGGPPLTFLDLDNANQTIAEDRYLALSDLQGICPVLHGYEQDFRGAFVSVPNGEADTALLIEHPLQEGKLLIFVPFIMSFGMTALSACEPI